MSVIIEDFWPKSIDVRILTPLAILRSQAAFLEKRTGGLLTGLISTDRAPDKTCHRFYIVSNAPHRVVVPILEAYHPVMEVYPVEVVSRAFEPKPPTTPLEAIGRDVVLTQSSNRRDAATQDAFIALVKEVLNSETILASFNSLIAMSNEAVQPPIRNGENAPIDGTDSTEQSAAPEHQPAGNVRAEEP